MVQKRSLARRGANIPGSIQNTKILACRRRHGRAVEKPLGGWWQLSKRAINLRNSRYARRPTSRRANIRTTRKMLASGIYGRLVLKWALGGSLLIMLVGTAAAETGAVRQRYAATASDACFASCSTANADCRRVCPAVLGTSCLASCDSQYQSCTRGCQGR